MSMENRITQNLVWHLEKSRTSSTEHRGNRNPSAGALDGTTFLERPPLSVPLNLSEWVEPELLADWVCEAVQNLQSTKLELENYQGYPAGSRYWDILAVLVYAYSTQRFVSEEISAAQCSDPIIKRLCKNKAPFSHEIDHFRRNNRDLIENLLGEIVLWAVKQHFVKTGHLPAGLQHSLFRQAAVRLDAARHMSTWED
jgi:hypothetical protein